MNQKQYDYIEAQLADVGVPADLERLLTMRWPDEEDGDEEAMAIREGILNLLLMMTDNENAEDDGVFVKPEAKSSLKAVAPRDRHERELQAALLAVFEKFAPDVAAQIARGEVPDTATLEAALRDAIEVKLVEAATDEGVRIGEEIAVQYDPAIINEAAVQFAKTYTYDLVKGLVDTTRKTLQNAISKYAEMPGMTRGDLEKLLQPAFGPVRASKIAVTEITRSYSASFSIMQDLLATDGIKMERVWVTSNDEIVRGCTICFPNHMKPENEWQNVPKSGPPGHVACRCSLVLRSVEETT